MNNCSASFFFFNFLIFLLSWTSFICLLASAWALCLLTKIKASLFKIISLYITFIIKKKKQTLLFSDPFLPEDVVCLILFLKLSPPPQFQTYLLLITLITANICCKICEFYSPHFHSRNLSTRKWCLFSPSFLLFFPNNW